MFGGEHQRSGAGGARRARPLSSVERGRGENGRVLSAIAPLAIREGVDAEMQEQRKLVALPSKL
jgi:hypothetical protein